MKDSLYFFLALALTILIASCTIDRETDVPLDVNNPVTEEVDNGPLQKITINPNRGYYDVVVMDIDRWEICLNLCRARSHCNSYYGHLWYQQGSFVFEGSCTAVYNFQLDMLTVTALDSGWDRGHIVYGLQFVEGTNDLYGSFVYFEYPRRTNGIDAWLVQGQLGPHIYGLDPLAKKQEVPTGYAPRVHPKKARILAEDKFKNSEN